MANIRSILTVCFLYAIASFCGVYSLSCDYCDRTNLTNSCGEPPNCNNGTALDACGCCFVCAKTENETCGGPWGIYGECADAFICVPDEDVPDELGAGGIFEPRTPRGRCVTREEYLVKTHKCLQELHYFLMTLHLSPIVRADGTASKCHKPNCTPEGWFVPVQCDKCNGECWCVDGSGNEIPNSRTNKKIVC